MASLPPTGTTSPPLAAPVWLKLDSADRAPYLDQAKAALLLAVNASLFVCALECLHYLRTAPFNLVALAYLPLTLVTLAVALGVALALVLTALQAADRFIPLARLPSAITAAIVLAPQLLVTAHLPGLVAATSWLSLGMLSVLTAVVVTTIGRLKLSDWAWMVSAVVPAAGSIHLLRSDFSLQRAAAGTFDLTFVYLHAVPLCSLLATAGLYLLLRHCRGKAAPRWLAWMLGAVAVLICYLALPRIPLGSATREGYFRIVLSLMIVIGASRLPLLKKAAWAVTVGACAVAAHGYFADFSDLGSKAGWSLSHNTVLAAAAVENTRVLEHLAAQRTAKLKLRPEYQAGLQVTKTANQWNAAREKTEESAYSVLLITIDALRYDALQYSGRAGENWTPNLNRLAPRCHRFTHVYAQGGWTSISVPSLIWSKYPRLLTFTPLYEDNEHGLHWRNRAPRGRWVEKRFQSPINEPDPNLPGILTKHGYQTVAIINDEFTGYFNPKLGFAKHFTWTFYPKAIRELRTDPQRRNAHLDEVTADITVNRLRAAGTRRFFIWTHFFAPHGPYAPPEDRAIPFGQYHGEVYFADLLVGRVLEQLRKQRRHRDTIVVVTADHGESFWEHNNNTHGTELFDHAMRVPLLFCVPQTEVTEVSTPVGLMDIAPTLLDYLGIPIPNSMHGFSLRGMMQGEPGSQQRPPVFMQTWQNEPKTQRRELDKLAVVKGHYKLILDARWNVFSLFDLDDDPDEQINLLEDWTEQTHEKFLELGGYLLGWRDIPRQH